MFTLNKKLFALAHSLSLCLNLSQVNILTVCFPKHKIFIYVMYQRMAFRSNIFLLQIPDAA